jgi:signal transduction histidine kinase
MERQMGRDTLKHVLRQHVQMLEHEFQTLLRTSSTWNALQTRSLDILTINIHRLSTTVESLADHESLSLDMRHELRNQITVVMGYAQLMLHRRAGELPPEASVCLHNMMVLVMHINTCLDRNKKKARNG